jgi:probable HAF family extracellular repeat protein
MNTIALGSIAKAVALAALVWVGRVQGQGYMVTDLGTLGGNQSDAWGINNSGQIVGWSRTNNDPNIQHAFIYYDGLMRNIGVMTDGSWSLAHGVNSEGQVVGYAMTNYYQAKYAFLYSDNKLKKLDNFTSNGKSFGTVARGINSSGQIAGVLMEGTLIYHAFLYSNDNILDLGTLGGETSVATAINDHGQVVGGAVATLGRFNNHAFLYSNGYMRDLGTLSKNMSDDYSIATGINNSGQIVGCSVVNGHSHAFIYFNGLMRDLGTVGSDLESEAEGINSAGQVVGVDTIGLVGKHAFLYSGGSMSHLNDLIVSQKPGWDLVEARAINDVGQIVGQGINPSGQSHAFLLNPIAPQPKQLTISPPSKGFIEVSVATISNKVTAIEKSEDLLLWTPIKAFADKLASEAFSLATKNQKQFVRPVTYPMATTAPFLNFPIHNGDTSKTAPVAAIFDHYGRTVIGEPNPPDGVVGTVMGDVFKVLPGGSSIDIAGVGTIIGDNNLPFAVVDPPLANLPFHYVGTQDEWGIHCLQYDAHTGYDYSYPMDTDVYAAAPGEIATDDDLRDFNLLNTISTQMANYHGLAIKHPNGYFTLYLHLSWIDPKYAEMTVNDYNWKPKKATVDASSLIGRVGNFEIDQNGERVPLPYHLHFGVWRIDGKQLNRVDPYGYYSTDGTQIYPPLWK